MVDYHTQKTNIIRDEVEGDIVVFSVVFVSLLIKSLLN
jgi:hypothetical protein